MYVTLFKLAGFAALAWVLLIFLPTWRVTRWIARSALFPVFLSILYLIGVAIAVSQSGFGFMRDFGDAEGVTRLLARQDIALIAWIHILAFDQLVGLFIYRDNMHHRYVPIVVQSVILFFTFMLGPIGFLAYFLARFARTGSLWESRSAVVTTSIAAGMNEPPRVRAIVRAGWDRLMETPTITWAGFAGIALGLFCLVIAAVRGPLIPPEGELHKAITFDIAVGIYLLTLAFLVPSAGFTEKERRRWIGWMIVIFTYSYSLETIQTLRGLDPRFSRVGSAADQIAGGLFALVAIGMIVMFVVLARRFFRRGRLDAHTPLLLAIRYGCAAIVLAGFAAGLWMSARQGRHTGSAGNILPLHALGFHGLQAIPIIALMLSWSGASDAETRKWVHITGIAWLAACAAVAWQTIIGRSVLEVAPATIASAFLLIIWTGIAAFAFWRWVFGGHRAYT